MNMENVIGQPLNQLDGNKGQLNWKGARSSGKYNKD